MSSYRLHCHILPSGARRRHRKLEFFKGNLPKAFSLLRFYSGMGLLSQSRRSAYRVRHESDSFALENSRARARHPPRKGAEFYARAHEGACWLDWWCVSINCKNMFIFRKICLMCVCVVSVREYVLIASQAYDIWAPSSIFLSKYSMVGRTQHRISMHRNCAAWFWTSDSFSGFLFAIPSACRPHKGKHISKVTRCSQLYDGDCFSVLFAKRARRCMGWRLLQEPSVRF